MSQKIVVDVECDDENNAHVRVSIESGVLLEFQVRKGTSAAYDVVPIDMDGASVKLRLDVVAPSKEPDPLSHVAKKRLEEP